MRSTTERAGLLRSALFVTSLGRVLSFRPSLYRRRSAMAITAARSEPGGISTGSLLPAIPIDAQRGALGREDDEHRTSGYEIADGGSVTRRAHKGTPAAAGSSPAVYEEKSCREAREARDR